MSSHFLLQGIFLTQGSLMSPALQADSLPPEPPGKLGGEQKEKGATEDEVVGWYRGLNEHEFEQYMGDSE